MEKQKTLEKTLVLGIIILLTTAIIPSVNAVRTFTKDNSYNYLNPLNLAPPVPRIEGIMGQNFWFISDVSITFLYSPTDVKEIWYNYGSWKQYNDVPIVVSTDGKITIPWKYIDNNDIEHLGVVINFNLDKTPPTITLTKTSGANDQVIFTAKCEDTVSEIDYVEFYLDNAYQATDNSTPYKWTYTGTDQHNVYATAYNMAGLKKNSETVKTPRIFTSFIDFINEILQKIIHRIWN